MQEDNINNQSYTNRELWIIIENIMEKFDKFSEENSLQNQEIKQMIYDMGEKLDKSLEKKADLWVEKAFTWLLYTIGGFIVAAFMYLILK